MAAAGKPVFAHLLEVEENLYEAIGVDPEDMWASGMPFPGENFTWVKEVVQFGFSAVIFFRRIEKEKTQQ